MNKDCFARKDGGCSVLTSTRCKDKPCAFYKTKSQLSEERQKSCALLTERGRLDVFDRYDIPKE